VATEKKEYALQRDYIKVGEVLRKAREKAGLTQRQVSLELGYSSAQNISNFECGIAVPPLKRLKVLANIYDLNVPKLIEIAIDAERGILRKTLKSE
jgi:transcriptional regulator with XRE-family HTH domain